MVSTYDKIVREGAARAGVQLVEDVHGHVVSLDLLHNEVLFKVDAQPPVWIRVGAQLLEGDPDGAAGRVAHEIHHSGLAPTPAPDPVLAHIAQAIHEQDRRGARRCELVVIAGMNAGAKIETAFERLRGFPEHSRSPGDLACDYPMLWQAMGTDLGRWWRGEILGVPIVKDPDCPTNYWRVQRLPAIAHPPEFGKDARWQWNGAKWMRREPCQICGATDHERLQTVFGEVTACPQAPTDRFVVVATHYGAEPTLTFFPIHDREDPTPRVDGLTAQECFERVEMMGREDPDRTLVNLTPDQSKAARVEWARRLRELQHEARELELHQVVLDMDWD